MGPGKVFLMVVGILLAIILIVGGSWAFRYYTAEIRGTVDAEEQLESSQSRISRYEEFFNLCATVQTRERALQAQKERLINSPHADSRELSRIRSNIAALESQRERAINTYNARASQAYTSGRFKASNLPHRLDPSKEKTQCEL